MHLVIGAIVVLGTLFYVISRMLDAAGDAKSAARRFSWSRRVNKSAIDLVDTPKQVAAILLVQIAKYKGDVSAEQKAAIFNEMRSAEFGPEKEREELFAFARLVINDVGDAANVLTKLTRPLRSSLTPHEIRDLIDMMSRVAAVDGAVNDPQTALIQSVRRAFLN